VQKDGEDRALCRVEWKVGGWREGGLSMQWRQELGGVGGGEASLIYKQRQLWGRQNKLPKHPVVGVRKAGASLLLTEASLGPMATG
jgi:hypothetical protein